MAKKMRWKKYKKKYRVSPHENAARRKVRLQKLRVRVVFILLFMLSVTFFYLFKAGQLHLQISKLNLNTILGLISALAGLISAYFAAFPPNLYTDDTKAKIKDFKRFLPRHFINIDCQDKSTSQDTEQTPVRQSLRLIVWDWLFDPDPQQTKKSFLLLLGDFGTGKTTICYYMAQEIVTTMRTMDAEVIQLGRENLSLAEKLQAIEVDKRDSTVLFLDAYDEYRQRIKGEQEFDSLLELASNFYKVIITSRTHYFSHKKAEPHLSTRYISYFSQEQIKQFFKLNYPWRWKQYLDTINQYENLSDLAQRVVLLNYMSREVIMWMREQKAKNVDINTFKLYEKIIDFILPAEEGPNELLSRDMALEVMSILGFHIVCCEGVSRLHYKMMTNDILTILETMNMKDSELAKILRNPQNLEHLANWMVEVRARTFLIRDEPGYYYFAHRSFTEYFAALFIIKRILQQKRKLDIHFQVDEIVIKLILEADVEKNQLLSLIQNVKTKYRLEPKKLNRNTVDKMLKTYDFFDIFGNPSGRGISHIYEEFTIEKDKVVCDFTTGLMWQRSGSPDLKYWGEEVGDYIRNLNEQNFAGYNDWRLPTLEEAMSLMEPKQKHDFYIDPIFDSRQGWIWTCDQFEDAPRAWVVYFDIGSCYDSPIDDSYGYYFVRAVRSRTSLVE